MADRKPKFINEYVPFSLLKSVQGRYNLFKRIVIQRIESSKYLIEKTFGVNAEKVVDIFSKAFDASTKDFPLSINFTSLKTPKENTLYNQYITFLWEYYVKDKSKKKTNQKQPEPPKPPGSQNGKEPDGPPEKSTLYEGTKEQDLVSETIDERILKILGITDVFDIDYETYLSLLKEKLVQVSLGKGNLARDEELLLQDEFKRVKGKVGRFKIKKQKINADTITNSGPIRVSTQKYFLASKVTVPEINSSVEAPGDDIKKIIEDIKNSVIKIASLLGSQNKLFQADIDNQRRMRENLSRQQKESGLEKSENKLQKMFSKLFAPVKGILDAIVNWIVMTFLGGMAVKFMKWIGDKKNKDKVDTLFRFLKDWWPALLGAWFLFANPLGKFIRTIIGSIVKLTVRLAKFAIPRVAAFIAANPVTSGIAALAIGSGIGAYASTQQVKKTRDQNKKTDNTVVTPEDTAKNKKGPDATQLLGEQTQSRGFNMFKGGGFIPKRTIAPQSGQIKDIGFAEGGSITDDTGLKVSGAGKDTQLIAAQPGEVVISKPAVDKFGANFFLGLNKAGGGTNIPKMNNNVQLAAGGGMVGASSIMKPTQPIPKNNVNIASSNSHSTRSSTNLNLAKTGENNVSSLPKDSKPKKYSSKSGDSILPLPSTGSIKNIMSTNKNNYNINLNKEKSNNPRGSFMPFAVPVANVINSISKPANVSYYNKFEKKNFNIAPDIKPKYIPEPPTIGGGNIISLPPIKIESKTSGGPSLITSNKQVPDFAVSRSSAHRTNNLQIYGITGVT